MSPTSGAPNNAQLTLDSIDSDARTLTQVRPLMRVGVGETIGDGAVRAVDDTVVRSEQVV